MLYLSEAGGGPGEQVAVVRKQGGNVEVKDGDEWHEARLQRSPSGPHSPMVSWLLWRAAGTPLQG